MTARSEQTQRIASLLRNHCNVAVHAAPGTGKTWLADEVIGLLGREQAVVRFDLSMLRSGAEVIQGIAEDLGEVIDISDVHAGWRSLRRVLAERTTSLIVVLDEFDAVIRYPDASNFLPIFRELVHRKSVTQAAALIVSRRPLETIEAEIRGISTLATLCYPEFLGALQEGDIQSLAPSGECLKEAAVARCVAWSAGYPPLVKYWVSVWPREPSPDVGGHQLVTHFGRLVDYLESVGLGDAMAQCVLGPIVDDWIRERRQLEVLGVLASDSSTGYASHNVFQDFLRSRSAGLNPWGVLGLAEIRLRTLISNTFEDHWGSDWVRDISPGNKVINNAFSDARLKQDADISKFGRASGWLAYTYPQDLTNILLSCWNNFSHVFKKGDRRYWTERLTKLAEYRTPVAHNRVDVLSVAQRTQCRLYAEEIIAVIDAHAKFSR